MSQRREASSLQGEQDETVASVKEHSQSDLISGALDRSVSACSEDSSIAESSRKRIRLEGVASISVEEEENRMRECRTLVQFVAAPLSESITGAMRSPAVNCSGPFLSLGTHATIDVPMDCPNVNCASGLFHSSVDDNHGSEKKIMGAMLKQEDTKVPSTDEIELLIGPPAGFPTQSQAGKISQRDQAYPWKQKIISAPASQACFIDDMKTRLGSRMKYEGRADQSFGSEQQNGYKDWKLEAQRVKSRLQAKQIQANGSAMKMMQNSHLQAPVVSQKHSDIFARLLAAPTSSSQPGGMQGKSSFHVMDTSHGRSDHPVQRWPELSSSKNGSVPPQDVNHRRSSRFSQPSSSSVLPPMMNGTRYSNSMLFPNAAVDCKSSFGRQIPWQSALDPLLPLQQQQSLLQAATGTWKAPHSMLPPREEYQNIGSLLQRRFESGTAPSVTVVIEGRSIGRGVCLQDYDSYEGFAKALREMFGSEARPVEESKSGGEPCGLENAIPGYKVAYEDSEGDLLLAGDLSWREFVRAAKRIRLLPNRRSPKSAAINIITTQKHESTM